MDLPVPRPTPETAPYWKAAAQGELHMQQCNACRKYYFYPRPTCPYCRGSEVTWRAVSGRARLVSYVINQRPLPPFDPKTPLVIGLVELEEGPRMMTNIVDVEAVPAALELDMELSVRFVTRGDQKLPVFAPAGGER